MSPTTIELIDLALALDEQADALMREQRTHAKAQRLRARSIGLALRLLNEPTAAMQQAMRACFQAADVRGDRVVADEIYVIADLMVCAKTRSAVWKEIGS